MEEENFAQGWISCYRSFINWEWFVDSKMVHIFFYCLLKANHKDNSWKGQIIKKGSFITSYEGISKATGISVQSTRTCLRKLKLTGEISLKSTNKYTLVTVLKYGIYQSSNLKLTINQQSTNNQLTTNNNDNNDNNLYSDEFEFLKDWKKAREHIDGTQTNITALTQSELIDFNQLKKEFTIKKFQNAITGLFNQKNMFPVSRLRPTHFLRDRNIEKYLDCSINGKQLFREPQKELKL